MKRVEKDRKTLVKEKDRKTIVKEWQEKPGVGARAEGACAWLSPPDWQPRQLLPHINFEARQLFREAADLCT